MNKDKKGLIKYLSIFIIELLICLLIFFSGAMILAASFYEDIIVIIALALFAFSLILYLLLPIIMTVLAIKNKWSKYLDKFFNHLLAPTILFIIVAIAIILVVKVGILNGYKPFLLTLYCVIVPPYCIIYFTILIYNICKWIKRFKK